MTSRSRSFAASPLGVLSRIADHGLIVRIAMSEPDPHQTAAAWAAGGARIFLLADGPAVPPPVLPDDALLGLEATSAADLEGAPQRVDFVLDRSDGAVVAAASRRARIARIAACADSDGIDVAELGGAEICVLAQRPGIVASVAGRREHSVLFAEARAISTDEVHPSLAGLVVSPKGTDGGSDLAAAMLAAIRAARGVPLFGAVEHFGLYPRDGVSPESIAGWYERAFALPVRTARTTFVGRGVAGRIEVMSQPSTASCHVAIAVRDFEEALRDLANRGYRTEASYLTPTSKVAYLVDPDPLGNLVHIIWRAA